MAHYLSNTAIDRPFITKHDEGEPSRDLRTPEVRPLLSIAYQFSKTRLIGNESPRTLVNLLDDDSLLIIFSLCRPVILDESEADDARILGGGEWIRER